MINKVTLTILLSLLLNVTLFSQNWSTIPSGTTNKLNDIHFPSENIGYAVGDPFTLLKTIDGGKTWVQSVPVGINFMGATNITKVEFINDNVGFVLLENRGVYKTVDGGVSWTVESMSGAICFPEDIFFFDENNGFAAGGQCFAGESVEKKVAGSWTTLTTLNTMAPNSITSIDFKNTNEGLAASERGWIYKTIDGGANWDTIFNVNSGDSTIYDIKWINDSTVIACVKSSFISLYISFDNGATWQQETNSATFFYPQMLSTDALPNDYSIFVGHHSGFAGNPKGMVYEHKGLYWTYEELAQPLSGVCSFNDSISFAVGDSGFIATNRVFDTTTTANGIGLAALEILEAFPNPTNNSILITGLQQFANSNYQLVSFNGQILKTGSVEYAQLKIDLNDLASGLYHFVLLNDSVPVAKVAISKIE